MTTDERVEAVALAAELQAIRSGVDAFNPDARMAAHSAFDAAEQVWKLVPRIIASLEAIPAQQEVTEAIRVGERFLDACVSAWSCGEPEHRVRTMLDRADEFRSAIAAMRSAALGGDGE